MKLKQAAGMALAGMAAAALLTGCGGGKKSDEGSVYYLNFKPEVAEVWEQIAKEYTEETGVDVKVVTAASGGYESTLKSEVAKKNPPTLFQINGPVGYQSWKNYCLDLKDTELYSNLSDKDLAITDGDGVYGIPYVVEGYGIIYNDAIMQKYFALSDKAAAVTTVDEINDFDTLKAVVEDMTAHKDELGIEGIFSSTSFAAGEDWRWQTHLANVPVYYEYQKDGVTDKKELDFTFSDNFKNLFDLYLNNSVTEPGLVGAKTVEDSMAEFALGKTAMVQNGNWGWGQISGISGNTVQAESVKFLPMYTGMSGDNEQGLCIGTENYFSVNSKVSEADQKATIDFVNWLTASEKGKAHMTNDLGFIAPFSTFTAEEQPDDPLAQEIVKSMNDDSKTTVTWNFTSFPSQTFKDNFGASLLQYAQGKKEWDAVVTDMKADWAAEKAAIAE
ncbi:MAG: ABC transporter substrate-binding protein [Lachnospiraceae bacterium]